MEPAGSSKMFVTIYHTPSCCIPETVLLALTAMNENDSNMKAF